MAVAVAEPTQCCVALSQEKAAEPAPPDAVVTAPLTAVELCAARDQYDKTFSHSPVGTAPDGEVQRVWMAPASGHVRGS